MSNFQCSVCQGKPGKSFRPSLDAAPVMYSCGQCGFAFTIPLPQADEMEDYYEGTYTNNEYWKKRNQRSVQDYWRHLAPLFPKKPFRFLEVGGAFGFFSAKVQSEAGAEVVMLECGKSAAQFARDELGLEVFSDFFENYQPEEKFDVIFSAHVVEHVSDVWQYFEHSRKLLNPGGQTILITPNGQAWKFRLFGPFWCWVMPEHLHFLSVKSAEIIASNCGFVTCRSLPFGSAGWHYPGVLLGLISRFYRVAKHFLARRSVRDIVVTKENPPKISPVYAALRRWAFVEQKLFYPLDRVFGGDEILIVATLPR